MRAIASASPWTPEPQPDCLAVLLHHPAGCSIPGADDGRTGPQKPQGSKLTLVLVLVQVLETSSVERRRTTNDTVLSALSTLTIMAMRISSELLLLKSNLRAKPFGVITSLSCHRILLHHARSLRCVLPMTQNYAGKRGNPCSQKKIDREEKDKWHTRAQSSPWRARTRTSRNCRVSSFPRIFEQIASV
jgi:hypothetical protein